MGLRSGSDSPTEARAQRKVERNEADIRVVEGGRDRRPSSVSFF